MTCNICPTTHLCPLCTGTGTTSDLCPSCLGKRGAFETEGGYDNTRGEFHAPYFSAQCRSCYGEGIAFDRCKDCFGVGYLRLYCESCEEEFRRRNSWDDREKVSVEDRESEMKEMSDVGGRSESSEKAPAL
jgi:RecJ-like exonuclease